MQCYIGFCTPTRTLKDFKNGDLNVDVRVTQEKALVPTIGPPNLRDLRRHG